MDSLELDAETQGLSYGQKFLRSKILAWSRKYVAGLAKEPIEVDHLYAGKRRDATNFDMKKTLAVLLQSLVERVDLLELQVAEIKANRTLLSRFPDDQSVKVDRAGLKQIYSGQFEDCSLPKDYKAHYPNCDGKVDWMKTFWRSDPCYAHRGVDGSICSILIYLSEVEHHCPKLSFRRAVPTPEQLNVRYAALQSDIGGLFALMKDNPVNFEWIKGRLRRLWPSWVAAYERLFAKQGWTLEKRVRKRVLLHLGLLTKETGLKFGEKSLKGGPLGELIQWSDLMASLYILGHEIIISSEIRTFLDYAKADPALKSSCPVAPGQEHVSVIYTDIMGLRQIKKKMKASLQNYQCRLRVLDSFGTQAEFNHMPYYLRHRAELTRGKSKNVWGGHQLNLKQFYTMYPHSHDNSFLGFVVEAHGAEGNVTYAPEGSFVEVPTQYGPKRGLPWALVYGKEAYMWAEKEGVLESIRDLVEIHGTVTDEQMARKANVPLTKLPSYVINHGVLSGPEFHDLLKKCAVFLGLGFPYEGPAPLEAIANGAVYINPKFAVPKSRLTEHFFADKPTLRALRSQNPYAEDLIGPPFVLTVDISNSTELREAVRTATSIKISPFLPYEFTADGMLERINAYLEHQDLCADAQSANWPPFSAMHIQLSKANASCEEACWAAGFFCEPTYFPKINNDQTFVSNAGLQSCDTTSVSEPYAPSISREKDAYGNRCFTQGDARLFSCASRAALQERVCPCRDYVKGQSALCAACM